MKVADINSYPPKKTQINMSNEKVPFQKERFVFHHFVQGRFWRSAHPTTQHPSASRAVATAILLIKKICTRPQLVVFWTTRLESWRTGEPVYLYEIGIMMIIMMVITIVTQLIIKYIVYIYICQCIIVTTYKSQYGTAGDVRNETQPKVEF